MYTRREIKIDVVFVVSRKAQWFAGRHVPPFADDKDAFVKMFMWLLQGQVGLMKYQITLFEN